MSSTIKAELEQKVKDLEELNMERGKAEGRLEQAMSDLESLGFRTLEEAKDELTRLEAVKAEAEEKAKDLLEKFKVKYSEFIE